MDRFIDLHVHSSCSDGTLSPAELIFKAKNSCLEAVALTDHDTVDGIEAFLSTGKKYDFETVPGIELAAEYKNRELHIVGLFIDHTNRELIYQTEKIRKGREERNLIIIERLSKLKMPITIDELNDAAGGNVISRAHFAKVLFDKGYVSSVNEAFSKYISDGCYAYVRRVLPTPYECIEIIKNAGGKAILAHPTLYKMNYLEMYNMCKELKNIGLDGIEVMYPTYSLKQESEVTKICNSLKLKKSGGSDFHGANKPDIDIGVGKGNLRIPYSFLEDMR